ncbi:HotDog domain-containing protein [Xylariaceae sp. FL0255]|nr:HotDog domain-containing protein [Xylariaceae sp. FL0255]
MFRPLCRRALSRSTSKPLSISSDHPRPKSIPIQNTRSITSAGLRLRQIPVRAYPFRFAFIFTAGLALGTVGKFTLVPPELPEPGSKEDLDLLSSINERGVTLPIVQQLSADPAWSSWEAYSGLTKQPTAPAPSTTSSSSEYDTTATQAGRITSGPMSGSAGLAFQRIFRNSMTGEVISIIYFGPSLAGWPGVVHGGALATVLDESLGRCAILRFPSRTGVTANLELQYRGPTWTNQFYIIRSKPIMPPEKEDIAADGSRRSDRKLWVEATMESAEKGKTCVEAKALFVVPKSLQLKPLGDGF